MKRITKTALAIVIGAWCTASYASPTAVRVSEGEQVKAEFMLADTPTVRYTEMGIEISAGEATVVYPASGTYTFTLADGAGITATMAELVQISADGQEVTVTGLAPKAIIRAYTIAGQKIAESAADNDGCSRLSLQGAKGTAIISTPTKTFKIILR